MRNSFKVFAVFFLTYSIAFGQDKKNVSMSPATLCGKVGQSGPAPSGSYTISELKDCDFKIIPTNTDLTVTGFKLTIIPKNNSAFQFKEINGNQIPEDYRAQILSTVKNVFLESIVATDKQGNKVQISPIVIRITKD